EAVWRGVAEIETRIAAEHVERHAIAGGDVEDEAGRADQGFGRGAGPDRVIRLQHDVGLEPDDLAEEVAEPGAPTHPVRQVEGLVVLGPGPGGAELGGG